jgi:hypothetical protein
LFFNISKKKKMSDFVRIKVGYNDFGYNSTIAEKTVIKDSIQDIVNEILALNLGITFDAEDPALIFADPKAFFCIKLVTAPMLNGLELDQTKVFDLMKKPKALTDFVDFLNDKIKNGFQTAKNPFFFRYAAEYTIQNNIVILKQSVIDAVSEQFSLYVTNQNQKDIWDQLELIKESVTSIKTINANFTIDQLMQKYFRVYNNTIEIDFRELKQII